MSPARRWATRSPTWAADPDVKYAVPNFKAHASVIWNDPGRSGEARRLDEPPVELHRRASVNAPEAWDLATELGAPGGRGAVVALIDTGVAYRTRGRFKRAPDLRRRTFVRGYDFVGRDRRPHDLFGHGTHVAGTIAQHVNNGIGVTGLAYNAKIMPVRVLDENGEGGAYEIARGIRYAAKHGADVDQPEPRVRPVDHGPPGAGDHLGDQVRAQEGRGRGGGGGQRVGRERRVPRPRALRDLGRRDHRAPLPGRLLELGQRPRHRRARRRQRRAPTTTTRATRRTAAPS